MNNLFYFAFENGFILQRLDFLDLEFYIDMKCNTYSIGSNFSQHIFEIYSYR